MSVGSGLRRSTTHRTSWLTPGHVLMAFILLWAPFGEELFYRGFLFEILEGRSGFWVAALISSACLAVRHFAHLLYLQPFPWGAGTAWAVSVVPIGVAQAALYQRTGSIVPCIAVHLLLNLPM